MINQYKKNLNYYYQYLIKIFFLFYNSLLNSYIEILLLDIHNNLNL